MLDEAAGGTTVVLRAYRLSVIGMCVPGSDAPMHAAHVVLNDGGYPGKDAYADETTSYTGPEVVPAAWDQRVPDVVEECDGGRGHVISRAC